MSESDPRSHDKLFFSGRTLQQAVLAAARHFRVEPDEIVYQARDKRQGFVKSPKVVIEVDPRAPRRAASPAPAAPAPTTAATAARPAPTAPPPPAERARPNRSPAPADAETPRAVVSPEEARIALGDVLGRLCRLARLDLAVEVEEEGTGWRARLTGPDEKRLSQDLALVDALEHLVPRVLRGLLGGSLGVRVVVGEDALRRERELRQLAEKAAREALETRSPVTMPRLNSFERRLVHMVVAELPGVVSESVGEGADRRLVIRAGRRST